MTRYSKQARKRAMSPRKPRRPGVKTGPKKDALKAGFREHFNAVIGDESQSAFIPRIK